ncbi:MAG: protein-glutamate O-methyltransferase CheR [Ruminiclostridium sp.]|nr:protein-glutamate O-methyltransferase CheR [Ruminiclostridium sp.]
MKPITRTEFNLLREILSERFGIELKEEKRALVESRLGKVLQARGMDSLSEYLEVVLQDTSGELERELAEKLTTNHTYFLREEEHFHFFSNTVLPWLSGTVRDRDLRIWSAGCSSGEEAYTLAMVMADFFNYSWGEWNTKLLATDISTAILEKATTAIYPEESLEKMPNRWKKLYFNRLNNGTVQVGERIRDELIFRHLNLNEPRFPFKRKFHVIFCRNVMIYFNMQMKQELIRKFYQWTEPGGYLFIGHSESLGRNTMGYQYIKPSIYRKEP